MIKSNRIIKILLAISLLCIVFSGLSFEKREVFAEQKVVAPTESDSVIQVVEGFVLKDNTSLRLSGRAIKFTSVVSKDFHQEISKNGAVTYFATMGIVGENNKVCIAFGQQPDFSDCKEWTLSTYLNFESLSQELVQTAITTEFETETYAVVDDGAGLTYYKAKNSNTVKRSMRAVASDLYLNFEEGLGYEKQDILDLEYFTVKNVSSKITGKINKNGQLAFSMPELSGVDTGEKFIAYCRSNAVEVSYEPLTDTFSGQVGKLLSKGECENVILFDGENMYSTKVMAVEDSLIRITLDYSYDVKFSESHKRPAENWNITKLDGGYYVVHLKCSPTTVVESEILTERITNLVFPSVKIIDPLPKDGQLADFCFGNKWRCFLDDGYVDFYQNQNIVQYKSNGTKVKQLTIDEFNELAKSKLTRGGICEVVFRPYCRSDWT